jgi:type II secretory pathway component PulM
MNLPPFPNSSDTEPRTAHRTQRAMATTSMLWVVVFLCAVMIAATIGELSERAQIETQIQATRAQNAALQQDIKKTTKELDFARSPAEIEIEARRWGYH